LHPKPRNTAGLFFCAYGGKNRIFSPIIDRTLWKIRQTPPFWQNVLFLNKTMAGGRGPGFVNENLQGPPGRSIFPGKPPPQPLPVLDLPAMP
jgi:hypothetical protein